MAEIVHYLTPAGADPIQSWLDQLEDVKTRMAVLRRVDRLAAGNFGDPSFWETAFGNCGWTSDPGIECISADTAPLLCCYFGAEPSEHSAPTQIERCDSSQIFNGDCIDSQVQETSFQKP